MTEAYARHTDPDTSHAAATMDPTRLEAEVLEVIKRYPRGCIADDVVDALPHYRQHSITPRFKPLEKKGLIEYTGELRKAVSGRNQRVVIAVGRESE